MVVAKKERLNVRVEIRLHREIKKKLEIASKQAGKSEASIIRDCLQLYLMTKEVQMLNNKMDVIAKFLIVFYVVCAIWIAIVVIYL